MAKTKDRDLARCAAARKLVRKNYRALKEMKRGHRTAWLASQLEAGGFTVPAVAVLQGYIRYVRKSFEARAANRCASSKPRVAKRLVSPDIKIEIHGNTVHVITTTVQKMTAAAYLKQQLK